MYDEENRLRLAYYGVPDDIRARVWDYLPPILSDVCRAFEVWQKKREI